MFGSVFFLFNVNISKGMKEKEKELYEAPVIQVLELKQEGVICASGGAQLSNYNEESGCEW